jgi:hypothetical protein
MYRSSRDPIPAKAILLSEAFGRVVEAIEANSSPLETLSEWDKLELKWSKERDEADDFWAGDSSEDKLKFHRSKEANLFFRRCLVAKELLTYVRDPETGDILELAAVGWSLPAQFPPPLYPNIPALMSDFVSPGYTGPRGTFIRGAFRPVFLWRDDFERWLRKTFGTATYKPQGRPQGSGSWEDADEVLLQAMHKLIKSGTAKSAYDAARRVADTAPGSGTFESRRSRLARRYNQRFRSVGDK